MLRPRFDIGESHNILEYKHRALHDKMKRDVTTIDGEVVSVVYKTNEPTFTGVIGGYTTSDGSDEEAAATSYESTDQASATRSAYVSIYTDESSSSEDSQPTQTSHSNIYSQILASGPTASSQNGQASATATQSTPITSSNANAASSSDSASESQGMSVGSEAGLAIGIILAVGAVLGLVLFLLNKKKKQVKAEQARQDAEKNAASAAAAAAAASAAAAREKQEPTAPQLTLRPASSFLPEILSGGKNRLSQGNMLGGSNQESHQMREQYLARSEPRNAPMTEKPLPAENPFRDPENPFADPARSPPQPHMAPAPVAMPEPAPAPAPVPMPMPAPDHMSEKIAVNAYERSPYNDNFNSQEPIEMPSPPIGVQHSQPVQPVQPVQPPQPPQPVVAAAPPIRSAPPADEGNVYRVLLDFIPSMDDELELRAGQVVRLLHEYDDGWCLAAKLDRSRQGAVPRTCLAQKPSKPRPGPGPRPNGPPGPNGRPMSPSMRNGPPPQGRPMSPGMGMGRPMSPGGRNMGPPPNGMRPMSPGAYNQSPRPLSPGPRSTVQKRSMSPGPYGHSGGPPPMGHSQRRRSNSSSQTAREVRDRRQSPPGPSPLNPATVPGMAI